MPKTFLRQLRALRIEVYIFRLIWPIWYPPQKPKRIELIPKGRALQYQVRKLIFRASVVVDRSDVFGVQHSISEPLTEVLKSIRTPHFFGLLAHFFSLPEFWSVPFFWGGKSLQKKFSVLFLITY